MLFTPGGVLLSLVVDEHRHYLADHARLSAFRQAIEEVVRPGAVVLDLGAGTGILGLLACRAGARQVYAIDEGGIIEVARSLCRANGFQDRVCFIKGFSRHVDLPEKADVVVADQIGRFGFDAGVLEYFNDARERFLKPGGLTIPSRVDLWVAPVEHGLMWEQVDFWNGSCEGLDLSPVRPWAANTGYPVGLSPDHLLGTPVRAASLDCAGDLPPSFALEASALATRAGLLHGIGGWFSAQLSETVTMSNSPTARHPINRANVFFPVEHPVGLAAGDRVQINMHIIPAELLITWTVEVSEDGGKGARKARFTHSTFRGMLISREDLQRTQPGFRPRLMPRGEARRTVLELCDGQRALAEIEAEVYRRHHPLFRSPDEAAVFVAEVVTRYSV
jgi:protein arginine N-methyltransferase 1